MPAGPSSGRPALVVDSATKTFRIPEERPHTLKERALHPFRRTRYEELRALRGVSFAVEQGEFFGIVGRNGSGKSTLLKCMAGIYGLDSGAIYVDGRLSSFIELGVGFNMDLPARDNVEINGIMLGLSPRDARARFDSIIDFAELGDFVDLKLKNYSSGMLVRLAFAVMVQIEADVLLIDEVLAVGDAAFQQKCYDAFNRIRDEGRTVVLVTHDMGAINRFCDRALLLEEGRVVAVGEPRRVGLEYMEENFRREAAPQVAGSADETHGGAERERDRFGDRRAEIVAAWFEDEQGRRAGSLPSGRRCAFLAQVRFREAVEDPVFGVSIQNSRGETVLAANTLRDQPRTGRFRPGDELTFRVGFDNLFAPDRYVATPAIAHSAGLAWIDRRERWVDVIVTGTESTDAAVLLPYEVDLLAGSVLDVAETTP